MSRHPHRKTELHAPAVWPRVLPVVTVPSPEVAVNLAASLVRAGIPALEITLRSEASLAAITAIKNMFPDLAVWAGTVLNRHDASAAITAGAEGLVSPGFNAALVDYCQERHWPHVPGVNSPTDIEAAIRAKVTDLKFFPAVASGGIAMLQAFAGPYPMVRFMPTGGIDADNVAAYLALENVFCVGGSWMAPDDEIARGDWDSIGQRLSTLRTLLDE